MKNRCFLFGSILLLSGNAFANDPAKEKSSKKMTCPEPSNHQVYDDSFSFECDFLYWYVSQQGNAYASTGTYFQDPPSLVSLTEKGSVYAPSSKMEPGFKVGMGVNLDRDNWDLFFRYSWINSHQTSSVTSTDAYSGIVPLFVYDIGGVGALSKTGFDTPGLTRYVSSSTGDWRFYLNAIDVEVAKSTYISTLFSLRSQFGLKASWQSEKLKLAYQVSGNYGNNLVQTDQDFWGVGPRLGVDLDLCLAEPKAFLKDSPLSINFISSAALSALYSQFSVTAKSYDTIVGSYTSVLIANQKYVAKKVTPLMEAMIGLELKKSFQNCSRLAFSAGWENQMWFDMNQHSSSVADISLTLSGLTLKLRYDY